MRNTGGALLAAALLTACGEKGAGGRQEADGDERPDLPQRAGDASLEEFAGGRVRTVWVQQQKAGQLDQHAAGKSLKLMGMDSADGHGERAILDEVGSYARPLLTADGERVVFSNKGVNKSSSGVRSYRPRCYVVDFDGGGLRELGAGFAEAVWRDPADGATWVYVAVEFKDDKSVVMEAKRLERFRLDAPEKRELVWDKTRVGAGGFRLSRDGAKMVGLYPWPDAGVVDTASGELTRLGNGCWTSIAPDASRICWVFDGAHRNITLFEPSGGELGMLALNSHPDLEGNRVYHPRWTNHPRYAVLTGPYLQDKKKGAARVEVYLVKFAPDLRAIEAFQKVTDNKRADLYADIWIEGGNDVSLGELGAPKPPPAVAEEDWPAAGSDPVFAWKSSRENVEVGGEICRVRAEGAARYGRRFDLAPGAGRFLGEGIEFDPGDWEGPFAFEAVVTLAEKGGVVFEAGPYRLRQVGGELQFTVATGSEERLGRFGAAAASKPFHIWIGSKGGEFEVKIDGDDVALETARLGLAREVTNRALYFGGGGWDGRLERVAVYRSADAGVSPPPPEALARQPVEGRVRLSGKLLEVTPVPEVSELGAYTRALVYHLYEVEKVEDGEFAAPRVAVAHWAILDRKPAAGLPAELGSTYTFDLDPLDAHRELKSERTFETLSDLDAPVYFDTRMPELMSADPK